MAKQETELKRAFRLALKKAGIWSEAYEPGKGSGVGYPDLQLLVGSSLMPVELKNVQLVGGRVRLLDDGEVRASQVLWHFDLWRAGGRSAFIGGIKTGKDEFQLWGLPGNEGKLLRGKGTTQAELLGVLPDVSGAIVFLESIVRR